MECSGASLMNAAELDRPWTGVALDASYAKVEGSVLLAMGFPARERSALGRGWGTAWIARADFPKLFAAGVNLKRDGAGCDQSGCERDGVFRPGILGQRTHFPLRRKDRRKLSIATGQASNPVIKDVSESGTVSMRKQRRQGARRFWLRNDNKSSYVNQRNSVGYQVDSNLLSIITQKTGNTNVDFGK